MDDFEVLTLDPAERSMDVLVGSGSRFFAGHFPDRPLLPAVAHLVLVDELTRRCLGPDVSIVAVPQARWTRPVRPGARLRVHLLEAGEPDHCRFAIDADGERAADGTIILRAAGRE